MSIFQNDVLFNLAYGTAVVGGAALIGWGGFCIYKFFCGSGAGGGNISSLAINPVSSGGVDPIQIPTIHIPNIRPGTAMKYTPDNEYAFLSDFVKNLKFSSVYEPELSFYEIIISFFGDMIILYGEHSSVLLCFVAV